eukprot:TRINITY_DN40795_c0_g1_i1.p1 TRINITY_DN40795_c0_g1~~TRINITY_DN40795_c0_g1_i1.p1  ORF type:complete len:467 (-),score=94.37 TRINITY_DN40795_c0_g1_i1:99-1358(-)
MVASGALLDFVTENMEVFKDVPALVILVPALLGLKGNLEMTLGARLGSHANKGELKSEMFGTIVSSNLMAIQCQAIIVGSAAAILAIAENYAATQDWNSKHSLLLAASAITAASLASLLLASLMIVIVVVASSRGIDPDNITAPIAGTLGDFVTLSIVVLVAKGFWALPDALFSGLTFLLLAYWVVAVFCGAKACSADCTFQVMKYGWYPVLASMFLSNLSGPISQASIARFKTFALFQVVMNGAGGNLGAIMSSKLSTDLAIAKAQLEGESKAEPKLPVLPAGFRTLTKQLGTMGQTKMELFDTMSPHMNIETSWIDMREDMSYAQNWLTVRALTASGDMARFARMLFILILPGQALFACIVVGQASGWSALPTPLFLVCFVSASALQVLILIMAARSLVVMLWRMRIDPDNGASTLA